jgi:hypothetical protein
MKNRLVCILSCLMLVNPFAFGFHCHWNRGRLRCHRRHTLTPTPIPAKIPAVQNDTVIEPTVTPEAKPVSMRTLAPTPTAKRGGWWSSAKTEQDIENEARYWHRYFMLGRRNGEQGVDYYLNQQHRLNFRKTVSRQVIPEHIEEHYLLYIAIFDPDPTAYDKCYPVYENDVVEGKQCLHEHYEGLVEQRNQDQHKDL